MQCYFLLIVCVFLFACSSGIHGAIQPIYVRPLSAHYTLGRDVAQQQNPHQQQQLHYVITDDGAVDDDGKDDDGVQEALQQPQQVGVLNMATLPVADEMYDEAEVTPVYLETDDYSFLPDRMPDLADDEYVTVANDEHQTPLAYLKKQGGQVRLFSNEMNQLQFNPMPQPSAQPIYISMPIYINTPNANQQRPMLISMSTLPLATRSPLPPNTQVSEDEHSPAMDNEMVEQEMAAEPVYEVEMEPQMEEPKSPTSHYNRLLRNYYQKARTFDVAPASLGRAFHPTAMSSGMRMGMGNTSGRAVTHGRGRIRVPMMRAPQMPFMPQLQQLYNRPRMPPYPYGFFPMK